MDAKKSLTGCLLLWLGLGLAARAEAQTFTLQAVADTSVRDSPANQNRGSDPILQLSRHGRVLVRFDQGSLASTAGSGHLVSASLELFVHATSEWGAAGRPVEIHRLTAAWTEAGATWNCAVDADPANNKQDCATAWAGGAFEVAASDTVRQMADVGYRLSFDVTADVAAFLTGAANNGWLIWKPDADPSGRAEYTSREGAVAERPRLVLVFTPAGGEDTTPPVIAITSPGDGMLVSSPTVTVTGTVSDDAGIASLTVNGLDAAVTNGTFQTAVDLAEGSNAIFAIATDTSYQRSTATVVVTLDSTPPTLTVDSPTLDQSTNQATIGVTGSAADPNGIGAVTVNGTPVPLNGGRFDAPVTLAEGGNTVTVAATDTAGNRRETVIALTRFSLPAVTITSPADLSYLAATTVDVSGTVSDPVTSVVVNGVSAQVSGTSFTVPAVPLIEGGNTITATATSSPGHVATATINVVRDLTPPHVVIYSPADGTTVSQPTVVVSGLINDIVPGTVNQGQAAVTINGAPAAVANRSFLLPFLTLAPGPNVIMAVATDASGNRTRVQVTVTYQPPAGPRLRIAAGDQQTGVIGAALPSPLTIEALNGAGLPVANRAMIFKVMGNNGSLDGGKREILVRTDATGKAAVHFTLGGRAGAGNQTVEVSAVGFAGPAVFHESASPGAPALVVVDAGDQQVGVAGQHLPRPIIAAVVDSGSNRLAGVPVTFQVVKGLGRFDNGQPTLTLATDSDGRAITTFITGPDEGIGNNVVTARVGGLPGGQSAAFAASGWVARDASQTAISGLVVDNSNQPVPGVTLRIRGTAITTQADAQGLFRIAPAPVGNVELIVDGSTAQRPGSWPDLEYDLTTIPGRDNTLGMPVYLLPLDEAEGLLIDETHGGTLTLAEVPGFTLEIAPGSVTFPGGSRSGVVSATVVHGDKVPMVPNFGQQPRLILTIQPPGARFDPPARMTLPNVEGLAPGQVTEMYSFDHDLGHFVSIGPATVSDDGATIVANLGAGIVKGGWHCCGYPQGTGAPNHCPECRMCDGNDCIEDPAKVGKDCETPSGKVCSKGDCVCAKPVNFHETTHRDLGGGNIYFEYSWESSTGRLEDLANCQIGEIVVFPSNPFKWPDPWTFSSGSPVGGKPSSGASGKLTDLHQAYNPPPIVPPYKNASFVTIQRYGVTCPCLMLAPGAIKILAGPWPIFREVQRGPTGKWQVCITKSGITSCGDLQ